MCLSLSCKKTVFVIGFIKEARFSQLDLSFSQFSKLWFRFLQSQDMHSDSQAVIGMCEQVIVSLTIKNTICNVIGSSGAVNNTVMALWLDDGYPLCT